MISHRDEEGFSSCSAHPCHHAVVTTQPEEPGASINFAGFCCLRSKPISSTSGAVIPRLHHVRFRYSLVTRNHPFDGPVGRLQGLGLPPPCYPSYGAPILTPVGLTPTECASLRWTHRPARCSLHVTACILAESPSDPFASEGWSQSRFLLDCSDCYWLERKLPGGVRTH